jgi:surface antigen
MQKIKKLSSNSSLRAALLILAVFAVLGGVKIVHADQYDAAINALNSQNESARGVLNGLQTQAGSYQEVINRLQAQIDSVRGQIAANQAQQAELQRQIAENQATIADKKSDLGATIKAMYIDGDISTIEQLATSKDLSDYVDKEEYRTSVQTQLNEKIKEIASLQAKLQTQKGTLDGLLKSQQAQNAQLSSDQEKQNQLLAYNEGQQSAYNSQIAANSGQIAALRKAQIAANARFSGGAAGSGPTCGGGYPAIWCNAPQDSLLDSWGMYNRECVSYTAFKVAASGRYMPYWGGVGNANQWDDNARRAGIPVDGSPRAGDVAISNSGFYGHAMYVESVNSNGTINISQYNASLDGRYSTNTISRGSLVFIHF